MIKKRRSIQIRILIKRVADTEILYMKIPASHHIKSGFLYCR
jgi:hypothetical protein